MIMPNLVCDRRRSVRVACDHAVKVRCGVTGKYLTGRTLDISDGGYLMRLDRRIPLEVGQAVRVGISHRPNFTLIFTEDMAEARVVRCHAHGDHQHVAISFQNTTTLAEAS